MLSTFAFGSRPISAGPSFPRAFGLQAITGEYGFAAWSYSRQAKLNAWGWHGVGALGNINSWATLGNSVYVRCENNDYVHQLQPDTFYTETDTNTESTSVEATTQWLDFGKPGKLKGLTGLDCDVQNVSSIEIYVSEDGDRDGVLVETVLVGSNQDGWTYSGEVLPLSCAGTEFKLRFIGDANLEVQVNRLTIHFDELAG